MKKTLLCMGVSISIGWLCLPVQAENVAVDPRAAYNQGVDFYNKLDYNKAGEQFSQAMNTEGRRVEQWTAYNLGNTKFKEAGMQEQQNPQAAASLYSDALEFFRRALELDHADNDAKYNFEITAVKIKELQQQNQDKKHDQENKEQPPAPKNTDKSDQSKQNQQQPEQPENQNKNQEQPPEQEQRNNEQARQQPEQKEMTKDQALMLLENFQQAEDKQQALRQETQRPESSGGKDW
jgi:hypothetical protein